MLVLPPPRQFHRAAIQELVDLTGLEPAPTSLTSSNATDYTTSPHQRYQKLYDSGEYSENHEAKQLAQYARNLQALRRSDEAASLPTSAYPSWQTLVQEFPP